MGSSMGEMYCKQTVRYSNGQFYGCIEMYWAVLWVRCIVNRQCDILMGSSMGEMYCKQTVRYSNGQFYG